MAQPTFFFDITTPEKNLYSADVTQVTLPTAEGEITVLAHHIPLVSLLVPGVLHIIPKNGAEETMAVSGGFIEVVGDKVHVLADAAERAEDIDLQRAEEAKERAEEAMRKTQHDAESSARAVADLEKALARVRAARRHQRRRETHREMPLTE